LTAPDDALRWIDASEGMLDLMWSVGGSPPYGRALNSEAAAAHELLAKCEGATMRTGSVSGTRPRRSILRAGRPMSRDQRSSRA
jgi:hypothetical protein